MKTVNDVLRLAFNSLFEMQLWLFGLLGQEEKGKAFNSLFEMPEIAYDIITVKIPDITFNSLFEMLRLACEALRRRRHKLSILYLRCTRQGGAAEAAP